MRAKDSLVSTLDRSWKEFSRAWKKARTKASEKSIHDLRVNTRRLIATLGLMRALSRDTEITDLQRRVKKILKSMGPLRDIQVQLEGISEMPESDILQDFTRTLQRREKKEIKAIRAQLKQGRKRSLSKQISRIQGGLVKREQRADATKAKRAVERILASRRDEFITSHRRFSGDDVTLHEMRIALKKLRYAVEAAQPMLNGSAKRSAVKMHDFQQLMGNTRDIEILRTELEKWADKKGKKLAVVPVLDQLREKQEGLLHKITKSSADLQSVFTPTEFRLKPENTPPILNSVTEDSSVTEAADTEHPTPSTGGLVS